MPGQNQALSVVLIAAAPETNIEYIADLLDQERQQGNEVFVIAVDGGRHKAQRLGITPDFYIGDFDSSHNDFHGEKLILPEEKDVSDTEAAIEYAIERKPARLLITGALGGRQDHCLCNVMALLDPRFNDVVACVADAQNRIFVAGSSSFSVPEGFSYFSLIPVDPCMSGVYISGAKYPLTNATLHRYKSLGLSNQAVEPVVTIAVGAGKGLLIFSKD